VPAELTIIAITALLAGLLLVGVMLAGRSEPGAARDRIGEARALPETRGQAAGDGGGTTVENTLRVVWWLTITIVLLGVGISGSFVSDQAPIFLLGGAAVAAVVVFHELLRGRRRTSLVNLAELVVAIALIGGLLALTGFASSPFAMLFALVTVTAALSHGARAGLAAAGLATVAFGVVLVSDPALATYGPDDALRLTIGLGATWLLAFVAIAYADHQRRVVQRAIDLSRTDALTGLFNRSQLFMTLEQEVSRTRRSDRGFCLLMIDLDGLKTVNDTGGHLRGDEVLRAVGAVISRSTRTVDSAYRFGGDEFVVLLPETDIVGAFVVAEKIRLGAEELDLTIGGGGPGEPQVSVSIGLVSHPEDGLSAEELVAAADRAMYQAKSLGKNQISGNPRPRPALLARRSTLEEPPTGTPPSSLPPRRSSEPPAADAAIGPSDDRAVAVELGPVIPAETERDHAEPEQAEPAPAEPETEVPVSTTVPAGSAAIAPGETPPAVSGEAESHDDSEPDAAEVRRRIAVASRSFDPDHQIRRAMDAFFSPNTVPSDRDQPREH
jgi:diguanylate cyclase (GGDEF)-like protein